LIDREIKEAKDDPMLTQDMIEYLRDECYERIENKHYRFFEIYFEGGAERRICPNCSPELTFDEDIEQHRNVLLLEDKKGRMMHHGMNPIWALH
jgi:hypothetical protein